MKEEVEDLEGITLKEGREVIMAETKEKNDKGELRYSQSHSP